MNKFTSVLLFCGVLAYCLSVTNFSPAVAEQSREKNSFSSKNDAIVLEEPHPSDTYYFSSADGKSLNLAYVVGRNCQNLGGFIITKKRYFVDSDDLTNWSEDPTLNLKSDVIQINKWKSQKHIPTGKFHCVPSSTDARKFMGLNAKVFGRAVDTVNGPLLVYYDDQFKPKLENIENSSYLVFKKRRIQIQEVISCSNQPGIFCALIKTEMLNKKNSFSKKYRILYWGRSKKILSASELQKEIIFEVEEGIFDEGIEYGLASGYMIPENLFNNLAIEKDERIKSKQRLFERVVSKME